jgi:hypothetical protein
MNKMWDKWEAEALRIRLLHEQAGTLGLLVDEQGYRVQCLLKVARAAEALVNGTPDRDEPLWRETEKAALRAALKGC